ncbi:MAG: hypothetical protein QGG09_15010 [Pirellulaceae bacterium]|nr:hypothetical protein [Pirellulaceae bacterium]HJN12038.1 hypothetical protein [Pirellulaceae bacterium]
MMARICGTMSHGTVTMLVAALIGLCAMPGETVESDRAALTRRSEADDSTEKKANRRTREGATLEAELGEFREAGERIRFYLRDDTTSFMALENLALDRVSRVLDESTSPRTWSVSGVITEYRSSNYLLVTRASLKARASRGTNVTPRN